MQIKRITLFVENEDYFKVDLSNFIVEKIKIRSIDVPHKCVTFDYYDVREHSTFYFDADPFTIFFSKGDEAYQCCQEFLEGRIRKQEIQLDQLNLYNKKLEDSYSIYKFAEKFGDKV